MHVRVIFQCAQWRPCHCLNPFVPPGFVNILLRNTKSRRREGSPKVARPQKVDHFKDARSLMRFTVMINEGELDFLVVPTGSEDHIKGPIDPSKHKGEDMWSFLLNLLYAIGLTRLFSVIH